MDSPKMQQQIKELAKQKNALILAHNYQRDEIQDLADITGDSLALSIAAAETDKQIIVFCGVHFMAESAAILAPDKTVLLPNRAAGCPMADMVTPETLEEMRAAHPGVPVVAYVNTSAATKAHSDICCTSANAVKVVKSLPDNEVILVPDRNLGSYIDSQVDKKCYLWPGYCPVHDQLMVQQVLTCKQEHPQAVCLAHPECPPAILEHTNQILSTGGMLEFVRNSSQRQFIIATERGILCQLKKDNPDKEFFFPDYEFICRDMKLTSLEDLLTCLQTMEPQIKVPEEIRRSAFSSLQRMLEVPRD
ncbi:MAG: quinolinate synthase [Desulfobacteraceae bacterium 4572_35.1]|nr:MAG: quinolinate synthase [Desulfobacteraceae bacterium 4572_35.1]